MKRIRIIHRLRVALAIAGFAGVIGVAATLWWANRTGLPDSWRGGIEEALASHGVYAELAGLRYFPLRGIQADGVSIYADPEHTRSIAHLDRLLLDMDRTKLSRGDFKVRRLELSGARVTLAVDPEDPDSKVLEINDARGRLEFSGERQLEVSGASGTVGGLRLELKILLQLYRPGAPGTPEDAERSRAERRRILLAIIDALEHFDLQAVAPPLLRIEVRGDLDAPGDFRADLNLRGADLVSRGIDLRHLDIAGEMRGRTLVLNQIDLGTPSGSASGKLEYELDAARGRFELRSDIDLPGLLNQLELVDRSLLPQLSAPPDINAHGNFAKLAGAWTYHVMGDLKLDDPHYRNLHLGKLETRFSWDGSRLLLEDLQAHKGPHRLQGRAFITPEGMRYALTTSLPLAFWQKSLSIEPLSSILEDFSARENSAVWVRCRGKADFRNPRDWWFKGRAEASNVSFRDVPARHAMVTMDLSHERQAYTAGEVDFDFRDYPLRNAHGGPSSGVVTVDRILYDHLEKTVQIDQLSGAVWPAPVVRTFAPKIADQLEAYRFHRPPLLLAQGKIGFAEGTGQQDLKVQFSTPSATSYEFLGKDLKLLGAKGTLRVRPDRIRIRGLETTTFGGQIRTNFESRFTSARLKGEVDWTNLSLIPICKAYDVKSRPAGAITGRTDFILQGRDISGLDATGHIALREGELFRVPIFGPLSPVLATVLGRRKIGFEEATDAFCTFQIEDGMLNTTDFITTTPSMVFTGDGRANLPDRSIDMTLRMNARGLLGVITLPLKPFYGLFQFRGRGPIENPEWENVMFTSPPKDQQARLLAPPKAQPIAEDAVNPKPRR